MSELTGDWLDGEFELSPLEPLFKDEGAPTLRGGERADHPRRVIAESLQHRLRVAEQHVHAIRSGLWGAGARAQLAGMMAEITFLARELLRG